MSPIPLREATDESVYGGKAVQLGAALRADLPVPAGIALSVAMVDAIVGGDDNARRRMGALLDGLGPRLAARSSAVGEDSTSASFAGVHASVLNVTSTDQLVRAIAAIHESASSAGALAYRAQKGVKGSARVAVVVQTMVPADRSGVMFTRDPVTDADERVIEASWGLGEAIVSGLVTPDLYRLDRDGAILEKRAGMKDRMMACDASEGTREISVDLPRQRSLCLDDACLRRLHLLANRCERAFGGTVGHDIEWTLAGPDLYLLQRRPVTARGAR